MRAGQVFSDAFIETKLSVVPGRKCCGQLIADWAAMLMNEITTVDGVIVWSICFVVFFFLLGMRVRRKPLVFGCSSINEYR